MTIALTLAAAAAFAQASNEPVLRGLERLRSEGFRVPVGLEAPTVPPSIRQDRQNYEALIDLLRDEDESVRSQAAKGLRDYALSYRRVQDALLAVAENGRETASVRREAIKSLSRAGQNNGVRDALLGLSKDARADEALRAIATKALYRTSQQHDVRESLLAVLRDRRQSGLMRQAAAFALFSAPQQEVRDLLLAVALDSRAENALRIEALRSLFDAARSSSRYGDQAMELAESQAPAAVRAVAILTLQGINGRHEVRRLLQRLAQSSSETELRSAAIQALAPALSRELAYFFHQAYPDLTLDPIENE